jgi:hypothetical protein
MELTPKVALETTETIVRRERDPREGKYPNTIIELPYGAVLPPSYYLSARLSRYAYVPKRKILVDLVEGIIEDHYGHKTQLELPTNLSSKEERQRYHLYLIALKYYVAFPYSSVHTSRQGKAQWFFMYQLISASIIVQRCVHLANKRYNEASRG